MLDLHGIQKRFGGVHALKGVDFSLAAGEVHVLLGENGAGTSTLMGVLSGAVVPDSGTIALDGNPVSFSSPRDAHAAGIAMIPQELDLVPGLDIAANLFLGNEITAGGVLQGRAMRRRAQDLLARAGVSLDAGLPGPSGGIRSVAEGEWAATFPYPTGAAQALELAKKILIDCATEVPRNVVVPTQRIDQTNAKEMFGKQQF